MDKISLWIRLFAFILMAFAGSTAMAFTLTSTAFTANSKIPARYTCDGENISPPLAWQDAPAQTASFALIIDDPDAPARIWDHWLVYGIPSNMHQLAENFVIHAPLIQGINSWGKAAYGGPCPPKGTHRYQFTLYALSILPPAKALDKTDLMQAMQGHILASTQLIGLYR